MGMVFYADLSPTYFETIVGEKQFAKKMLLLVSRYSGDLLGQSQGPRTPADHKTSSIHQVSDYLCIAKYVE